MRRHESLESLGLHVNYDKDGIFPRAVDPISHVVRESEPAGLGYDQYCQGYERGLKGYYPEAEARIHKIATRSHGHDNNYPNHYLLGYIHGLAEKREGRPCRGAIGLAESTMQWGHFPHVVRLNKLNAAKLAKKAAKAKKALKPTVTKVGKYVTTFAALIK